VGKRESKRSRAAERTLASGWPAGTHIAAAAVSAEQSSCSCRLAMNSSGAACRLAAGGTGGSRGAEKQGAGGLCERFFRPGEHDSPLISELFVLRLSTPVDGQY